MAINFDFELAETLDPVLIWTLLEYLPEWEDVTFRRDLLQTYPQLNKCKNFEEAQRFINKLYTQEHPKLIVAMTTIKHQVVADSQSINRVISKLFPGIGNHKYQIEVSVLPGSLAYLTDPPQIVLSYTAKNPSASVLHELVHLLIWEQLERRLSKMSSTDRMLFIELMTDQLLKSSHTKLAGQARQNYKVISKYNPKITKLWANWTTFDQQATGVLKIITS